MKALKAWILILGIIATIVGAAFLFFATTDLYDYAILLGISNDLMKTIGIAALAGGIFLIVLFIVITIVVKQRAKHGHYKHYSVKGKIASKIILIIIGVSFLSTAGLLLFSVYANQKTLTEQQILQYGLPGAACGILGLALLITGLSLKLRKSHAEDSKMGSVNENKDGTISLSCPKDPGDRFYPDAFVSSVDDLIKDGYDSIESVTVGDGCISITLKTSLSKKELDEQADRRLTYVETNGANKNEMPSYFFTKGFITYDYKDGEHKISTSRVKAYRTESYDRIEKTTYGDGHVESKVVGHDTTSVYDHDDLVTTESFERTYSFFDKNGNQLRERNGFPALVTLSFDIEIKRVRA